MIHFPTSSDISIEVNGRTLAVAQSYRAQALRESKVVEAFGEEEPVGTVGGRVKYQLELSRVSVTGTAGDGTDFHELDGFNVVIVKPGSRVVYSGCQWSAIDERASLGNVVLENVSIVASKRMELR